MGRTESSVPGFALDDDEFVPQLDDFIAKNREYLHFDLPLGESELQNFTASKADICCSPHWPLVGYVTKERRVRRQSDGSLKFQIKERPIKSHHTVTLRF